MTKIMKIKNALAPDRIRQILNLSGEWTLRQAGKNESIKATVPGSVHTDLLAAGKIPDPYYRDNEDRLQWIGEEDWIPLPG